MDAAASLPPDVLASLPPVAVALIAWQAEQIRALTARVAELESKLGRGPANSSQPPSSTHPHAKPALARPKSKRARGGQPGHPKHQRDLIPPEQCQQVVTCLPATCRFCGRRLAGADPAPLRHQVWELPEITPVVTEYRRHRLTCACGGRTCGALPPGVPAGQAGPRLVAFSALLMASFRQSKRRAALFLGAILNQPASAGWMVRLQGRAAEAVRPAYDELARRLPGEPVLHVDESPTKEGRSRAWVWTFVAAAFTLFACRTSRGADVPRGLLGEDYAGVLHCDRARMYWAFGPLQWCWAHLKRDFQALIDAPCGTRRRLGHDLMRAADALFALWRRVRDGTLPRSEFGAQARPIRARIDALLLRGYFNPRTHTLCKELVEHKEHLWTFLEREDVELTNNAAERALRHAVIWRKLSFGTQSGAGSTFVAHMLTVVETCRRQARPVFPWLVAAVEAHNRGERIPSLLPEA